MQITEDRAFDKRGERMVGFIDGKNRTSDGVRATSVINMNKFF